MTEEGGGSGGGGSGGRGSGGICGSGDGSTSAGCGSGGGSGSGTRSGPGGSGTGTGMPGPGPVVFGSFMRIVHRLALVLWSRLMFDDGAVVEVEPARARNTNPRPAARLRFLRPFTRRLARAKTPSDVGNGHVRTMNVPRRLETCDASQRLAAGCMGTAMSFSSVGSSTRCPRDRTARRT
jgi:hypothetical protein